MQGDHFTIIIPARNEAARLPLVLRNFARMQHVLVVDNYSTDETRQIAEQFGRRWIQVKNVGGFCETPEWMDPVLAEVTTPYILLAACAEYVPPSLLTNYDLIATTATHDVVYTRRVSITAGLPIAIDLPPKWLGFTYKGEVRFFRKGAVSYLGNIVHGRGTIMCPLDRVHFLPHHENLMFYQYRDYDCSETEEKHRVYNDTLAKQKYVNCARNGLLLGALRALKHFLFCYFIYGGFRYGALGFFNAYYRFHMVLSLVFRAYEYKHQLLKFNISNLHKKIREEKLRENDL